MDTKVGKLLKANKIYQPKANTENVGYRNRGCSEGSLFIEV